MLGYIGFLGGYELVALLVIGVLLFSARIPAAARSVAQGLVEFKRALLPNTSANAGNPSDPDQNPDA